MLAAERDIRAKSTPVKIRAEDRPPRLPQERDPAPATSHGPRERASTRWRHQWLTWANLKKR
eukprot:11200674-Lingulodinium_polyedra.AAC.1